MGWSGGTFSRVRDWTDDEAAGLNIEANLMDSEDDNFATGIDSCLHKGGQNTATSDLPMGGNKHTSVGEASARNQYAVVSQIQDNKLKFATTAGSGNTQTLTLSPAITAYQTGQAFTFKAGFTNTGGVTLNVNGVGAKNIVISTGVGASITGYEILANHIYTVVYDGTAFRLLNPSYQHAAIATRTTDQAFNSSTDTPIEFTTEEVDYSEAPMHDPGSNPSRFTVLRTGLYICTAYAKFSGVETDERAMWISVNDVPKYYQRLNSKALDGGDDTWGEISGIVLATQGQYIEFQVVNVTNNDDITEARGAVSLLVGS